MQEKYTKDEYRKLVNKGRRFLMEYLECISEGFVFEDPKNKELLFQVMSDEYRRFMREDEEFFRAIEEFCSKRRFKREKEAFFRRIVTGMIKVGNVRGECEKRDPEYAEYRKTAQLRKSDIQKGLVAK